MPVTRSTTARCGATLEEIVGTRCPIQKHFHTQYNRVNNWRKVLYDRYIEKCLPCGITATWRDNDKHHQQVQAPVSPPHPPELHHTIVQIWHKTSKLITITIFYTTHLIRAEGHGSQKWIDEEFEELKETIEEMQAVEMLSLPSTNTELNSNLPAPPPVPSLNSDNLNLIGQLTISDASEDSSESETYSENQSDRGSSEPERRPRDSDTDPLPDPQLFPPPGEHPAIPSTRGDNPLSATEQPEDTNSDGPYISDLSPDQDTPHPVLPNTDDKHHATEVNTTANSASHNAEGNANQQSPTPLPVTEGMPQLILTMQQQLADSVNVINTLQTELNKVRTELSSVKHECAKLRQEQQRVTSLVLDCEVKTKNVVKAAEIDLRDTLQTTTATLTKDHNTLADKVSQLTSCKNGHGDKLRDLQKQIDNLVMSERTTTDKKRDESSSPPTSRDNDNPSSSPSPTPSTHEITAMEPFSRPTSPTPSSVQEADDETFVKVPVRNRYDALTRLNGEENLASDAEKKKSEVDKRQNKSTENANHKQRPTPLERLMRMKIRSEATSLLIGDSVTQYVDKKRVSVGGAVVQNMSVSGLSIEHLLKWLSTLPPTPNIARVTVHVGINSCRNGPITKQTWLKLLNLLRTVFPQAILIMSSIVPPGGLHPLSKPAFTSNQSLKSACQQEQTIYIDNVPTFLASSGAPKQILYYDKLHPSDRGVRSLEWNIRNAGRPRASSNEDRLSSHQGQGDGPRQYRRPGSSQQNQRQGSQPYHDHHGPAAPSTYGRHNPATHQNVLQRPPLSQQAALQQRPQPSQQIHLLQQSDRSPPCPDRGHAGPPLISDTDYPRLQPQRPLHAPIIPPAAAGPSRGWEQQGPPNTSDPLQALRMIAQLMQPFFQ
ncbi:hypothetical protein BaRGS_00026832 [Batillaria attramentaria]|uniref:SGNH hydrolase-type esterase domain-containing protein n=1 Tax=Batillaria attramentaria TaxID=370345 RepID=A0ABD0K3T7_9CAEN